jgi:hypothetical protein
MSSSSFVGRQAFASFFCAMVQFKAHWYAIVLPSTPSDYDDLHHAVFPALSKLTSIEEQVMREVLLHCKLVQY